MLNTQFPSWPAYSPEEIEAVSAVLKSNRVNYWTGTECRDFEKEFAIWSGSPRAISLNNGTIALDLAVRAIGIDRGDEVVVTPRSFIASTSCVVAAGASPVFADVCPETQNLTADEIARVLTTRTKAIVCVHLGGMPCDMDPILDLARSRNLRVVEDCAQAHGARYKGRGVGAIGDVGAWSFCQDKILTTGGEGGMVTTTDDALAESIWSAKDHGKSSAAMAAAKSGNNFRWVHDSFGTNGRMLEMQAVIGRIQLRRIEEWSLLRRRNAGRIWSAAGRIAALRVPSIAGWAQHAAYRAYVFLRPEAIKAGWSRDRIISEINERGVPCYSGSCSEIYLEKAFEGTNWRPKHRLPNAQALGETSLMFLVHPTLTESHIDLTCDILRKVMGEAAR